MIRLTLVVLALLPALAGCAAARGPRGPSDLQRLREGCDARGGILVPSGAVTGQAARDNLCIINGPAVQPPAPTRGQ
jgi:hypothetical protein